MGGLFELKYKITDLFSTYINKGYMPEEAAKMCIGDYQNEINYHGVREAYILSVIMSLMVSFGGKITNEYIGYIGRVIIICSETDYVKEMNSYEIELLEEEINIINDIWESLQIE